jgi:hypothetical protein
MASAAILFQLFDRCLEYPVASAGVTPEARTGLTNCLTNLVDGLRLFRCQFRSIDDKLSRRTIYEKSSKLRERLGQESLLRDYVNESIGLAHVLCEYEYGGSYLQMLSAEVAAMFSKASGKVVAVETLGNMQSLLDCVLAIARKNSQYFVPQLEAWVSVCVKFIKKCPDEAKEVVLDFMASLLRIYHRIPLSEACREELAKLVIRMVADKDVRMAQFAAKCASVCNLQDLVMIMDSLQRVVDTYSLHPVHLGIALSRAMESSALSATPDSGVPEQSRGLQHLTSILTFGKGRKRTSSQFDLGCLRRIPSRLVPYVLSSFSDQLWKVHVDVILSFVGGLELPLQEQTWAMCLNSTHSIISNHVLQYFLEQTLDPSSVICARFDSAPLQTQLAVLRYMVSVPHIFNDCIVTQKWFEIWSHILASETEQLRVLAAKCCSMFGDVFTLVNNCISTCVLICSELSAGVSSSKRNQLLLLHGCGFSLSYLVERFIASPSLVMKLGSLVGKLLDIAGSASVEAGVCFQVSCNILSACWVHVSDLLPAVVDSFLLPTTFQCCSKLSYFLSDAGILQKSVAIPSMIRAFAFLLRLLQKYHRVSSAVDDGSPFKLDLEFWSAMSRSVAQLLSVEVLKKPFCNSSVDVLLSELMSFYAYCGIKATSLVHVAGLVIRSKEQPTIRKTPVDPQLRFFSLFEFSSATIFAEVSLDHKLLHSAAQLLGRHISFFEDVKTCQEALQKVQGFPLPLAICAFTKLHEASSDQLLASARVLPQMMVSLRKALFDSTAAVDQELLALFVHVLASRYGDDFCTAFLQIGFETFELYKSKSDLASFVRIEVFLQLLLDMLRGIMASSTVNSWLVATVSICSTFLTARSNAIAELCFSILADMVYLFPTHISQVSDTLFAVSVGHPISSSPRVLAALVSSDPSQLRNLPSSALSWLYFCDIKSVFALLASNVHLAGMSDIALLLACFLLDGRQDSWAGKLISLPSLITDVECCKMICVYLTNLSLTKPEVVRVWFSSFGDRSLDMWVRMKEWLSSISYLPRSCIATLLHGLLSQLMVSLPEYVAFVSEFSLKSSQPSERHNDSLRHRRISVEDSEDVDEKGNPQNAPDAATDALRSDAGQTDEDDEEFKPDEEFESGHAAGTADAQLLASSAEASLDCKLASLDVLLKIMQSDANMSQMETERACDLMCRIIVAYGLNELSSLSLRVLAFILAGSAAGRYPKLDDIFLSQFEVQLPTVFKLLDMSVGVDMVDAFCLCLSALGKLSASLKDRMARHIVSPLANPVMRMVEGLMGIVKYGIDLDGHAFEKVTFSMNALSVIPVVFLTDDVRSAICQASTRILFMEGELFSANNLDLISASTLDEIRRLAVGCLAKCVDNLDLAMVDRVVGVCLLESLNTCALAPAIGTIAFHVHSSRISSLIDALSPGELLDLLKYPAAVSVLFERRTWRTHLLGRIVVECPPRSLFDAACQVYGSDPTLASQLIMASSTIDHKSLPEDYCISDVYSSIILERRDFADVQDSDALRRTLARVIEDGSVSFDDALSLCVQFFRDKRLSCARAVLCALGDNASRIAARLGGRADVVLQLAFFCFLCCPDDDSRLFLGPSIFGVLAALGEIDKKPVLAAILKLRREVIPNLFQSIVSKLDSRILAALAELERC